jgi:transcriptional pleiotropic regulator of transition state genes
MSISKKIAKNGAITLPKKLRTEVGFFGGNAVDIEMADDGVKIKKHCPTCQMCGNVQNVVMVDGIEICADCAHKLHEAVMQNGNH